MRRKRGLALIPFEPKQLRKGPDTPIPDILAGIMPNVVTPSKRHWKRWVVALVVFGATVGIIMVIVGALVVLRLLHLM